MTSVLTKPLTGSRGRRLAQITFVGSCTMLAFALLVQAFLAGVAAMTNPIWWELHRAWVNIFQWLVLLPPVCALLARYPRWLTVTSLLPIVLIYLQYVWAEFGRDGTLEYGLGIHAASAMILFGLSVFLIAAAHLVAASRGRRQTFGDAGDQQARATHPD